jgi:hypothetical protein
MRDVMLEATAGFRFNAKETPGLVDHLLAGTDPEPGEIDTAAVEGFLNDEHVTGTELDADVRQRMGRDVGLEGLGDMWESVKQAFRPVRLLTVSTETKDVPLEAYWLTMPPTAGAKVTMTTSESSSEEYSGSLTIFGVGGGPTFTYEYADEVSFPADDPQRVDFLAPGTFDRIQAKKGDQVIAEWVRLQSVAWDQLKIRRQGCPQPDPKDWGRPIEAPSFELSHVNDATTKTVKVAAGTTWEIGAKLSFEKLGMEASIGAKMSYERALSYANELPGGHDYVASLYRGFPAYIWTVTR